MNLFYSKLELKYAQEAFQQFLVNCKATLDPEDYRHWNEFVNHLVNSMNKLLSIKESGGQHFQSEVDAALAFQKNDPLLSYIRASRNAYEHSTKEICSLKATSDVPNFHEYLSEVKTNADGTQTLTNTRKIPFYPASVQLIAVTNQFGKKIITYYPPTTFKGKPLKKDRDPVEVGQIALAYYKELYQRLALIDD